jgi:hypothetical protein
MKLHLDDTVIPLGTVRGFMYWWDKEETEEELDLDTEFEFAIDIAYPPIKYTKEGIIKELPEIVWSEMSYYKFTENSLRFSYDYYANGDW